MPRAALEPPLRDGRARFREIFCALVHAAGEASDDPGCDRLLWRYADEPAPPASPTPLPSADPRLRVFVVTGAFSDCFDEHALAFHAEIPRLAARGYRVELIPVSGRSSTAHNARQIAAALATRGLADDDRVVLVGYSKGSVDSLQFLVDRPPAVGRVAALVSVAGPVYGSPAAGAVQGVYSVLAGSFGARCDPGDGGVIDSLLPTTRARWLAEHPLPADVAYFSLAAFPTTERLARGLRPAWQLLAAHDRRNDGQVAARDAIIPGATVLGFANADHWDVGVAFEAVAPSLGRRADPVPYPRGALLEAIVLYVGESVATLAPQRPSPETPAR